MPEDLLQKCSTSPQNTRRKMRDARFKVYDTRCDMQDAGCEVHAGCKIQEARCKSKPRCATSKMKMQAGLHFNTSTVHESNLKRSGKKFVLPRLVLPCFVLQSSCASRENAPKILFARFAICSSRPAPRFLGLVALMVRNTSYARCIEQFASCVSRGMAAAADRHFARSAKWLCRVRRRQRMPPPCRGRR